MKKPHPTPSRFKKGHYEPRPLIPIVGRRPVEELLQKGIRPEKLLILRRERHGKDERIIEPFRQAGWIIEESDRLQLDTLAEGLHHQGFVALIREFPYCQLDELIENALSSSPQPMLLALDEIQDVGNLGAILRTAECAGVAGAIIPFHRSANVTPAVIRSSAGAALHLPINRAINLSAALDRCQEAGFRIVGADQEGRQSLYNTDLHQPVVLVVGSEGRGLRPGIKRRCDALVTIPLRGKIASLNASVAAALCLYEAVRQRLG